VLTDPARSARILGDAAQAVHVDAAVRGLGTLSCGPDTAPRFVVGAGVHTWSWRLRLYDPRRDDPGVLARSLPALPAP